MTELTGMEDFTERIGEGTPYAATIYVHYDDLDEWAAGCLFDNDSLNRKSSLDIIPREISKGSRLGSWLCCVFKPSGVIAAMRACEWHADFVSALEAFRDLAVTP